MKRESSYKPHYADWELPNGWVWCRLDDIFEVNPRNIVEDSTICGFVPMANVEDGFSGEHTFIERKWGEVKKGYCHFQDGDIAVAKISPCFENLKSTIFKSLPNSVGAGTTELVILRNHIVYAPYFLYLFKSQWYIGKGTIYFKGVVGQQRVNRDIFTSLVVPVPPLSEQKRISSAINNIFDFIDLIENGITGINTCIDKLKQKILQLAINGRLVSQDPADEPAEELLRRINPSAEPADKSHYNFPLNWSVTHLYLLCDMYQPQTISTREMNANGRFLVYGANGIIGRYDKYNHEESELLMTCRGATCGNINVSEPFSWINGNAMVIHRKNTHEHILLKTYLELFLRTIDKNKIITGTAQPQITRISLNKVDIPLPPFNEQKRIVAKVEELFAVIDQILQSLE